jgi:hypothetical protein
MSTFTPNSGTERFTFGTHRTTRQHIDDTIKRLLYEAKLRRDKELLTNGISDLADVLADYIDTLELARLENATEWGERWLSEQYRRHMYRFQHLMTWLETEVEGSSAGAFFVDTKPMQEYPDLSARQGAVFEGKGVLGLPEEDTALGMMEEDYVMEEGEWS